MPPRQEARRGISARPTAHRLGERLAVPGRDINWHRKFVPGLFENQSKLIDN
jgi:hypothetical protein